MFKKVGKILDFIFQVLGYLSVISGITVVTLSLINFIIEPGLESAKIILFEVVFFLLSILFCYVMTGFARIVMCCEKWMQKSTVDFGE